MPTITTTAPADKHAVYSIGPGRVGVRACVNGSEVACSYDATSGDVTLTPRAEYFDAPNHTVVAGQAPIARGDQIEISYAA
jgi:hypothetical protein